MSVQLYKDGDQMAIQADCQSEDEFVRQFVAMLEILIENGEYDSDWEFQLERWLPQFVDICCAYRGYKNSVEKRTIVLSGSRLIPASPTHEFDPKKLRESLKDARPMESVEEMQAALQWCKKHEHAEPCVHCEEERAEALLT